MVKTVVKLGWSSATLCTAVMVPADCRPGRLNQQVPLRHAALAGPEPTKGSQATWIDRIELPMPMPSTGVPTGAGSSAAPRVSRSGTKWSAVGRATAAVQRVAATLSSTGPLSPSTR